MGISYSGRQCKMMHICSSSRRQTQWKARLSPVPPCHHLDSDNPFFPLAHTDFVKVRLNGIDSTSDKGLVNNSRGPGTAHRTIYYIIAPVVIVLGLACGGCFLICRTKKRKRAAAVFTSSSQPISYPSTYHPAPPMGVYGAPLPLYGQPTYIAQPGQSYHPQRLPYNGLYSSQHPQSLKYRTDPPIHNH